ncbi:hypothetical protein [Sphaerisporangium corydalis]|uniref:Uncharacterized protein n=1 Tax=Sphaerisporangium corydalis TaxID=1441875 RepID=A0ABV9EAH5_9ACTN|nr:hypothetical protein [Sphaerisporangium corydalis]
MNFADSSNIGVQAGVVHGDVYNYTTPPDPSPRERFETGLRHVQGNMPRLAWQLINEAAICGYATDQACFYWLVALLSGRTRHELSDEETTCLLNMDRLFLLSDDDSWTEGVRTIRRLLDSAEKPDADIRILMKELDALLPVQQDMIVRHLEMFFDGPLNDQMWHHAVRRADAERMAGNRENRVWKFFQPTPARPRVRAPEPVTIPGSTWTQAVTGSVVLVAATVHIGSLLVQRGRFAEILAYLMSIAGGYFGTREGVEWRFRSERRRTKDNDFARAPQRATNAPPGGFARRVDQRFDYYFAKYVPRGTDRDVWLARTVGIRKGMRDEVVEAYREKRVGVERINWLIRYRVGTVRARWEDGTLWNHRQELATPLPTKATAVLGALFLAVGGVWAATGAVQVSALSAIRSLLLLVVAGWIAARAWSRIILERRRHAVDTYESDVMSKALDVAFARWRQRLADKPEDGEMAAWLDCDRKVLLSEALQHYRLIMSNVIAHAFIEAPGGSTARARVRGGSWRYKKYQLLIFLLTADGVRQLTATLDFEHSTFHIDHRMNYRFEAVTAVRVKQADNGERTFELALMDGQKINVKVIEPGTEELQPGEDPGSVSEATLDAAGLHHTLHVLEGIAAEGKEWIAQEHRRSEARSRRLLSLPSDDEPTP